MPSKSIQVKPALKSAVLTKIPRKIPKTAAKKPIAVKKDTPAIAKKTSKSTPLKTTTSALAPSLLTYRRPQRMSVLTVLEITKEIEGLLEKYYGAQGRGLREKAESVAEKLPATIQYPIRMISAMRNKAAHESSFVPSKDLPPDYFQVAAEVKDFLLSGRLRQAFPA